MSAPPDTDPHPVSGLDEWLTAYGQSHDAHVHTETAGLMVAGLIRSDGSRVGVSWTDDEPLGQFAGTWGGWERMYFQAVLDTGPQVLVESRHVVHARECSSTTCIALWRRLWEFTAGSRRTGVDYLRVAATSGTGRSALAIVVDREQFEHEQYCDGRAAAAVESKWQAYASTTNLTRPRRPQTDNDGDR